MRAAHRLTILCLATLALVAGCTSSGSSGPSPTPPATADTTAAESPTSGAGAPSGTADSTPGSPSPASTSTSGSGTTPADWPTYHGDAARTGVSLSMPPVSGTPRTIEQFALDGALYASPVVVGGITVVATEHDVVYGFDRSYRQLWKVKLGNPSPSGERPCGDIDPLGITGTPVVVDGVVYLAPEFSSPLRHQLVAMDLRSGKVLWRHSLDLPGVETAAMQERGALTVSGGRIWVPFGGLAGDCGGYKGRVVGVRVGGAHDAITYTVPTDREAGIWTPPGPAVDSSGALFVAVGNGASGRGDRYDYSDSVLKIGTDAKLADSFSPSTWPTDNEGDLDLGSQGPALVGKWVFSAGKSGSAYVLRRSALGGIGGQVSTMSLCKSFGGTAVSGDVVYVPCTDGVRAVRIDAKGDMHVLWHADAAIVGSPVIGGGRVWATDPYHGVLYGLDPATGKVREQGTMKATNRFATPAIYGADLLIPTLTGLAVIRTS